MIINIQINKDLEVKVEIDDKVLSKKKEPKGEFGIQTKGAGDKAKEELSKQATDYITNI